MGIGYYICVPFAWLLRVLYEVTANYGWALILFTLAVKIVLLPFQMKTKKSMVRMSRLQPKINEINKKYANNQQKINEETQRLYIEEGVNPMGGCLWSLLPFPILLALYSIIRQPLTRFMMLPAATVEELTAKATELGFVAAEKTAYGEVLLAKFVSEHFSDFAEYVPQGLLNLRFNFLGMDLTMLPSEHLKEFFTGGWPVIGVVLIPVISALLSFAQSKIATAQSASTTDDAAARPNRTMTLLMPLMSLWIAYTLPASLGIYWIANSVFMIVQDVVLNAYYNKHLDEEVSEKERKKREDRLARMEAAVQEQRRREAENGGSRKPAQKKQGSSAKKEEKKTASTTEAGRVGDRPYARGRSFSPEHYGE